MARVIAVVNQKGGVGKTTTAINLSAALGLAGLRILLVDLDPQGNATTGLGLPKGSEGDADIYGCLLEHAPMASAAKETVAAGVSIVCSDIDLVGAEIELVGLSRREFRLKHALIPIRPGYDYVVVDCPPSLGLLTLNALVASDAILVPMLCEFYALEGLSSLVQTLQTVRKELNPKLKIEGIVLTMFDPRMNLASQVVAEVERHFPNHVMKTRIPRNVRLTEAPGFGRTVMAHDLRSPGALAYLELAREVLAHG